jgi:alpha-L-rhamnosidase
MAIAEVGGKLQNAKALLNADKTPGVIRPRTPYFYHYVAEALLITGQKAEAQAVVRDYWGAMIKAGAETFWEAFDPQQPRTAPYGAFHINSFCHAWNCTPSYLIRTLQLA